MPKYPAIDCLFKIFSNSWAEIHDYGLFHSEIVLYFLNCIPSSQ